MISFGSDNSFKSIIQIVPLLRILQDSRKLIQFFEQNEKKTKQIEIIDQIWLIKVNYALQYNIDY